MQVSPTYSNQLKNVSDAVSNQNTGGFKDGNTNPALDYKYNIRGWLTDINDVGLVLYGKDAEPPTMGDDLFAFKINYSVLNDGGSQYAEPLYNGNIAQTIWRTGDDNVKRGYVYNYDELNRLLEAQFYKSDNNPYTGAYTENLAYDLNGNITSLFRTTGDVYGESVGMDDLAYSYKDGNGNSNLLLNVSDAVSNQNTGGFKDGNTNPALDDYEYDLNGNMVKDRNKGITSITYNHLNLPERIEWSANKFITYQYNAAGQKVTKTVRDNDSIKVVRYLDGFQYAGDILQFFPHSEGYVKATPTGNITPAAPPTGYAYNYVFNYTDHLGNIRLSYTKDPQQGTLKILEENHYYPFGLKHEVYVTGSKRDFIENSNDPGETILTNVLKTDYQYKFNGKEWQDELNLNLYDFHARNYDPTTGRTNTIDPLAEKFATQSPYSFFNNNPLYFVDPTGMAGEDFIDINKETGKIKITKAAGDDQVRLVDNEGNVVKDDNGKEQSYTYGENGSFSKENKIVKEEKSTTVVSKNTEKMFQFFKFAAKSDVEFGYVKVTNTKDGSTAAAVRTDHNPDNVNSLPAYMRRILNANSHFIINMYSHSHPPTTDGTWNNLPSGFNHFGEPDGRSGDIDTIKSFNLDPSLKGRVPHGASVYSAQRNTLYFYNNEKTWSIPIP